MSESDGRTRLFHAFFLIKFAVLLTVFNLAGFLTDSIGIWSVDLTGKMVSGIMSGLEFNASYQNSVITIAGFVMIITMECTAIQYLGIFAAAIIAYPNRTARHKVIGIAAGSIIILLFNIVRIGVIGQIGAYAPDVFDFIHTYLWQGTFVVLIFILWHVWMNDSPAYRKIFPGQAAIALAAAAAATLLLKFVMPHYVLFLAVVSDIMLQFGRPVSVSSSEGLIVYNYGGQTSSYLVAFDIYYSASFFAIVAISLSGFHFRQLRIAGYGLLLLLSVHIAYANMGFFFADYYLKNHEVHDLWWYAKVESIISPALIGLWARKFILNRRN